jgi:hypothetical protein
MEGNGRIHVTARFVSPLRLVVSDGSSLCAAEPGMGLRLKRIYIQGPRGVLPALSDECQGRVR